MTVWRVARRNLTFRPVLTLVTALILGLAVGLAVTILLLSAALEDGLVRASRPFDLLVGAKGSPTQLIMSAMLLQDAPVGNIPLDYYAQLRRDPRVVHAAPLALGDNARGTPIIGVSQEFFALSDPASGRPYFAIDRGRLPAAQQLSLAATSAHDASHESEAGAAHLQEWEAVAGARAARSWRVNDTVQSHHGGVGEVVGEAHDAFYHVVGTLQPTDTPLDRALFVPIQSYWEVHAEGLDHPAAARQVTAVMVRPVGITEFYQLHQEINRDNTAQSVLSGQGMARLFDLLGQGRNLLSRVSFVALAMGAATVFLVSYTLGSQRRRETAILRALGAGRWAVFSLALAESLIIAVLGTALGIAVGHGVAWAIARRIQEASALAVRPSFLTAELLVALAVLLLAAAASLLPACQSYRQDVATNLAPN